MELKLFKNMYSAWKDKGNSKMFVKSNYIGLNGAKVVSLSQTGVLHLEGRKQPIDLYKITDFQLVAR